MTPPLPATSKVVRDGASARTTGYVRGVRVLRSPDGAQVWKSTGLDSAIAIGREAGAGVWVMLDPQISRIHARIELQGEQASIKDLQSRNGVFVNGARTTEAVLHAGDVFRLGDSLFEYDMVPAAAFVQRELIVGRSPRLLKALSRADRVAASELAVLLLGESGTGKEMFAHYVHEQSGRSGKFVAVNCAALPSELVEATLFGHVKGAFTGAQGDARGLVAEADAGTLFLDEIGELPLPMQAKLLRVLDSGDYMRVGEQTNRQAHVRVVAATNADLDRAMQDGRFRPDLHARIAGQVITLSPLRKRRADILPLFDAFVSGRSYSADFAEALLTYDWPLNVRELKTVSTRLLLAQPGGQPFVKSDLDEALGRDDDPEEDATVVAEQRAPSPSREELEELLRKHQGNVEAVALSLGRHRPQVYRWLRRYALNLDRFRGKHS